MSVQKAFVVKNGLEVNTDLIVANSFTKRVGVGSTTPRYNLDVLGSIGVDDIVVTGVATVTSLSATSGTITDLTSTNSNLTNINSSGISTLTNLSGTFINYTGVGTITRFISTDATITNISVVGVSTLGVTSTTELTAQTINSTGIVTAASLSIGSTEVISGSFQLKNITSLDATTTSTIENAIQNAPNTFADLNVTGVSTFVNGPVLVGGGTSTGVSSQVLQVSGINSSVYIGGDLNVGASVTATSFNGNINAGIGTITNLSGVDINYSGIITASSFRPSSGYYQSPNGTNSFYVYDGTGNVAFQGTIGASQLNSASGNSVITLSSNDASFTRDIRVAGISTLGSVVISSGIVTASSGIVTYYGDGRYLQNVISGVGINTAGGVVGSGATILDFRGPGISTVTVSSGIATINITGGGGGGSVSISSVAPLSPSNGNLWYSIEYGRTFIYYDEVALGVGSTAFWVDAAPFNVGVITSLTNVSFSPGTASSPSMFFVGDQQTGFFSPSPGQLTVVSSGSSVLNVNSSGVVVTGVVTASSFVGNVTGNATGLSGTPNLNVGVVTATSFRGSAQVGVATGGTYIGLATQFNFVGSGVAVNHTYNSTVGIATITITSTATGGGGSGLFNTGISSSVGYLITGSMATAYTAPALAGDEYIVHSIHVTNIDGTNSADVSGQMYAGQYSIAHLVPVPAGSSVELLKQPKILAPSETIQLQASATNTLHATVTVERKAGDTSYIGVGTDITAAATYTDLWTATANSMLQGILLANDDGTADVKARVVWTDSANNIQGYYAYDMTVPADATVEVLEQPKYLPSGYKVRVYANQANRLEAILSARTIA